MPYRRSVAGVLRFLIAVPLRVLPRHYWRRIDVSFPVFRAAFFSALATLVVAVAIGFSGFLADVHGMGGSAGDGIRMIAVYVEDPWGDPLLTIADNLVRRAWTRASFGNGVKALRCRTCW